ncbi:MAG: response regulator [Pirellulaceae bacterium]|nr:response regulator [Pirellulaceae bacterium]
MAFSKFWVVLVCTVTILTSYGSALSDDSLASITKAVQVKFMPADEAATGKALVLEGTVTCVPDGWKGFFLSDDTCGVYCEAKDTASEKTFWPVSVGEKLVLKGITKNGHRNSFVQVESVQRRTAGELSLPPLLGISDVLGNMKTQDANFVRLRGVMVRMVNIAGQMEYRLASQGLECEVVHAGFRVDPEQFSYTEVEISGAVIPLEDKNTFRLIVPNRSFFRVLNSREQFLASIPHTPLKSVIQSDPESDYGFVRFSADVFCQTNERTLLVDEGTGIETSTKLPFKGAVKQRLEVVGLRREFGHRVLLEHSEVLNQLPPQGLSFADQPSTPAIDESNLNQLVYWHGALVDRHSIDGREIQTFESRNGKRFSALILDRSGAQPTFNLGAVYRVAGLVITPTGELQDQVLAIRNYDDLKFESPPSLSNKAKLFIALVSSIFLMIGLIATSVSLGLLGNTKRKLEQARDELRMANENLEEKVKLRTKELIATNEKLVSEGQMRSLAEQQKDDFKVRLEDAVSLAELGSIYWNMKTQQSNWSEQSFRIHGLSVSAKSPSPDEYLGQFIQEDLDAFREYLELVANSLDRQQLRYRIHTNHGDLRWVHSISRAVRNGEGVVVGIESVIQEITESVLADERLRQSAKMEAIGRLAAGLAHDLNNALTIVQTSCYCLQVKHLDDSERLAHLAAIQVASEQSADLTKQLITYSRQQIVRPVRININRSIQRFELFLRQLLGEQVRIDTLLNQDLLDAELDPSQFEQILMNLLINARDAVEGIGNICIETRMTRIHALEPARYWALSPQPGNYVTLTIRDNGHGISNELLGKIFEPYFTTKPIERGTGLGLAVVHGIVKQHKGGISILSSPEFGTEFNIYFPAMSPLATELSNSKPECSTTSNRHGTESILLVDDEPMVLNATKILLETMGYKVTGVTSAAAALKEVAASRFDLLLTDISMPDMHGCLLAKKIRESQLEIPVIFMSGFLNDDAFLDEADGLQLRFIQKPFAIGTLLSTIKDTFEQSRAANNLKGPYRLPRWKSQQSGAKADA